MQQWKGLFNHLVGPNEQRQGHSDAERLGRFEVDDQFNPLSGLIPVGAVRSLPVHSPGPIPAPPTPRAGGATWQALAAPGKGPPGPRVASDLSRGSP